MQRPPSIRAFGAQGRVDWMEIVLLISLVSIVSGALRGTAAQPEASPSTAVLGIFNWNGRLSALLEIRPPGRGMIRPILHAGEKIQGVEVVSIDDKQGSVSIKDSEGIATFMVEGSRPQSEPRTFNLASASMVQLLEIYQEVANSTVIQGANLIGGSVDLRSAGLLSKSEALQSLNGALENLGLRAHSISNKFVCVLREADAERVASLPPVPPQGTEDPQLPADMQRIPAGMIKFQDADILQVLEILQELRGQTVVASPDLRAKISVRSQTALTRAETVWLMESCLRLVGSRVIPTGDKFVVVVPETMAGAPAVPNNATLVSDQQPSLPAGSLKFSQAGLPAVLSAYAKLCGREVVMTERPQWPPARISLRSQTALTPAEALFGLDMAAALNGVEIVASGDRGITARWKEVIGAPTPRPPRP